MYLLPIKSSSTTSADIRAEKIMDAISNVFEYTINNNQGVSLIYAVSINNLN